MSKLDQYINDCKVLEETLSALTWLDKKENKETIVQFVEFCQSYHKTLTGIYNHLPAECFTVLKDTLDNLQETINDVYFATVTAPNDPEFQKAIKDLEKL